MDDKDKMYKLFKEHKKTDMYNNSMKHFYENYEFLKTNKNDEMTTFIPESDSEYEYPNSD